MNKKENILIIGAGLCGSLLALRMAQRGYSVKVFEKRPDIRKADIGAGKSINLALSDRGIKAIRSAGILEQIVPLCIPMYGRMIHNIKGETFNAPYSGRQGEFINSISRTGLNAVMLEEAEKMPNVELFFNTPCLQIDEKQNQALFQNLDSGEKKEIQADLIFGTDGAGSILRKSYEKNRSFLFSHSQEFLSHGYKELSFPPNPMGDFQIQKNNLHIWPRGGYMLIALPNLDGSFTVTLFLSHSDGKYNFNSLKDPQLLKEFFETEFPDALQLIPNLTKEFAENPTGNLGTVKCHPWNYKGHTLLLGDAAHAIVPFYGQGMNASFEDVYVLDQFIDKYPNDWEKIFTKFQSHRKKDTDAIADLAIDNFVEMRDHVANPLFMEKRKIELKLEHNFPKTYFSKYSKVTFNEDLPYSDAMFEGRLQDQVIIKLIYTKTINAEMEATELWEIIEKNLKEEIEQQDIKSLLNA